MSFKNNYLREKWRCLILDRQSSDLDVNVYETCNSKDYIRFLQISDAIYPIGDRIGIVLDNLKVHTSDDTRRYLATVSGRFEFVFTPTHASCLNMVKSFQQDGKTDAVWNRVKSKGNSETISINILKRSMRRLSHSI